MQARTSSDVIGRAVSARRTSLSVSLTADAGSLSAGGTRASAAREGSGNCPRSAASAAAPLTTSEKGEPRETVGNEADYFCSGPSRGSGSVRRCKSQPCGRGLGEQVRPHSTATPHSLNDQPPTASPESSASISTAASPRTSKEGHISACPGTCEGPKSSATQMRGTRARRAHGGSSGVTRPVSGRGTAPAHQRRRLSNSSEVTTDSASTRVPCAFTMATSSPPMHTSATRPALSIPCFRTARTSASVEAFLLSFQNCLHRQELLFQRVDTAVAQLESASVNTGDVTVSSASSAPAAPHWGSGSLPRYTLPLHMSSHAPAAAATSASPTHSNTAGTLPCALAGAVSSSSSSGASDIPSSTLHTDSAPVLSGCASPLQRPPTDTLPHVQQHVLSQSTGSSAFSLSVVVMRPALERVGGSGVGSPMMCASSPGCLSPPQQTSPLLRSPQLRSPLLMSPAYVRVDGAEPTPTSAVPSRPSDLQTSLLSSTPETPSSPARLATTQQQLASNNRSPHSLSPDAKMLSSVTYSLPLSFSGRGAVGWQRCPAAEVGVLCDDQATEAPMLPALAEGMNVREAVVRAATASSAAVRPTPEAMEGSAGGRRKGSAATRPSTEESASASPMVRSARLPCLTAMSITDQSFNSGGAGSESDDVPTWSRAVPGHAKNGSLRTGSIPDSSLRSAVSDSTGSVSLSPLSRPPSIWVNTPMMQSTLGPTSPHQAPLLLLQQNFSLGGSSINAARMSPCRVPNSHNSCSSSSSNTAGTAQASRSRSPCVAAAVENPPHTLTAVSSTSSLPSTSQQQPQQRSSGDVPSSFAGQWLLSFSPTPTVLLRASGAAPRSSIQMTSVNLSGSGTRNIGGNNSSGNTGELATVMSSATVEGNVFSSLSSTSPRVPPPMVDSGGVATGATEGATSPVMTCRQLTLSSSLSAEGADRESSFQETSPRSLIGLAEEADDEDAQQLQRLANRYALPPPPPLLTELQQQQNQRRRWSAPPVPTMKRPPMAPLRRPDAPCPASLRSEEERLRSSPSPVARPEQWLLFEQQHERLHLPECWHDSEVVVVDHMAEDRECDAEEAERLLALEEELLRELRHNQSDWRDDDGLRRRGRRRGSRHRHLKTGVDAAGEMMSEEELDCGDGSADEAAVDAAYEARLARYGRAMLLHRRGRSHAARCRDGCEGGCSCGRCPSATGGCCRHRPASGGDRPCFPHDTTASLREASSCESTTPSAATGAHAGVPELPTRRFSRRHSAPATIWGADNRAEWRDLQARFEELISIQQRSRGSGREGAHGATLGERSLSTPANNTASSPMKGGLASGAPRRRRRSRSRSRSRSSSHEITTGPPDAEGGPVQGASAGEGNMSPSYRAEAPDCGDRRSSPLAPSPRTAAAPAPPSQTPEKQWISSADLFPYSAIPPSPPDEDVTSGQSSHARVSIVCTNTPVFLTSPRRPSMTVNAAHITSTRGCAETHTEAAADDNDGEDEGDPKGVMAARMPAVAAAQRTPRLRFTHPSGTASSMATLGRPQRTVGLRRAPGKGRKGIKATRASRADGWSKTGATPSATRTLSARQKPQTAVTPAVTATSGRRGHTAALRYGSCGSARAPSSAVGGGARFTRCRGANSAFEATAAASIVPAKEADDAAPTTVTESNSHGTTRMDTGATIAAAHPSDHALDGGELVEPLSAVLVVATPAAAAPAAALSPPTKTQKSARDSGRHRGRLQDGKAISSRGPNKDHGARDASLSSPCHRPARHSGAEGETAVSARPRQKASARHAPELPENEAKHLDGGATAGTSTMEGAHSRALLRRLAQQKDRTRAMEERLRFGVNSAALVSANSGSHSARSGCGSGFVWGDGHITSRWGLELESCTSTHSVGGACTAAELSRQDFSASLSMYSVSVATVDATLDTPAPRATTARHGGASAADSHHVKVVDPAETTVVYGVPTAHCGAGAGAGAGVDAAAPQTSSNSRRRRADVRSRMASKLSPVSASLSTSPANRCRGLTATVATAAAAQKLRRAQSACVIRTRSPTYVNSMRHVSYGNRQRHSISGGALTPGTLTVSERQVRSSRAPVGSQLVDWVHGGE
ncbi:hypothetical protein, conserved [Leishmania tarentolae]|uniref:Uncharacterized protein n=1 Tax=Leishmania tarentolae TaxID=5689 RepID=A0A640KCK6_LEITA|nr:hypothetical protein, conserved [Leishmania tarentolae]